MNPEKIKFYTELMKVLAAFVLGTASGLYGLITTYPEQSFLLTFVFVLCFVSLFIFISLIVYMDKNIWIMALANIFLVALTVLTVVGMGYFLIQILKKIFSDNNPSKKTVKI